MMIRCFFTLKKKNDKRRFAIEAESVDAARRRMIRDKVIDTPLDAVLLGIEKVIEPTPVVQPELEGFEAENG